MRLAVLVRKHLHGKHHAFVELGTGQIYREFGLVKDLDNAQVLIRQKRFVFVCRGAERVHFARMDAGWAREGGAGV